MNIRPTIFQALVLAASVMLLTACGAPGPIMSDGRSASGTASSSPTAYRVNPGETLYSIAFRYGLDWRDVASLNNISPPYTIRVGQTLRLRNQTTSIAGTPSSATSSGDNLPGQTGTIGPPPRSVESRTIVPLPPITAPAPSPSTETEPASVPERRPAVAAGPPTQPGSSTMPSTPGTTAAAASGSPLNIQTSGTGRSVAGARWYWPTEGRLTRQFNANDTRKGIHISGENGQAVRSTADGEVVYSGNGLIGYGELIIIKHTDSMLSAYAHNREREVEQGDRVQAGQQIASMGEFEPNRPLLHFEIRRNGQPDDPLNYLPQQ